MTTLSPLETASDDLMDHLPEVTELSGPHTDWQRLSEMALDALEAQAEELARLREALRVVEAVATADPPIGAQEAQMFCRKALAALAPAQADEQGGG